MSRIGKQLIIVPEGVTVKIEKSKIIVKGPRGELSQDIHPWVIVAQKENQIIVSVKNPEEKKHRALWGLFRQLIANMVEGVTKGFEKHLEIQGIGYGAELEGDTLVLKVGYSHPVKYRLPKGIIAKIEKNIITISGADRQQVGEVAAQIRAIKQPEPYKGKGIRYVGEIVRRKVGKTAIKTE